MPDKCSFVNKIRWGLGELEEEWGDKGAKGRRPASGIIQAIILLKVNNSKNCLLVSVELCVCVCVCGCVWSHSFIMACKNRLLNSWGKTEGKKKHAACVMGEWSMCQGMWMDMCPESSEPSFINFGPRSSPVLEHLSPGRRSLSQIQSGLSHPSPNWIIKSKWGGNLKLGTTCISLVK